MRLPRKKPLVEPDDLTLARRAAREDQAAFAVLVSRHERGLRAFLARAGAREGAEDIAQDTFLRAWTRAQAFTGKGSYAGWLYRIGWHLLLDRARQDQRRIRREASDGSEAAHVDPAGPAMVEADRLLSLLDPRSRAALILCEGHGWSHGEAAAMLGVPLGTLKSLISRAKLRLREHLSAGERP